MSKRWVSREPAGRVPRRRAVARSALASSLIAVAIGLLAPVLSSCARVGFNVEPFDVRWAAFPRLLCPGEPVTFLYWPDPRVTRLRIVPDVGELDLSRNSVDHTPSGTKTYKIEAYTGSSWWEPSTAKPMEIRVIQKNDPEELQAVGQSKARNNEPPCEWFTRYTAHDASSSLRVVSLENLATFDITIHHAGFSQPLTIPTGAPPVDLKATNEVVPLQGVWRFEPADETQFNNAIKALDPPRQNCIGVVISVRARLECE